MQHAAVPPRPRTIQSATARCRANASAMRLAIASSTCARAPPTRPPGPPFFISRRRGRRGTAGCGPAAWQRGRRSALNRARPATVADGTNALMLLPPLPRPAFFAWRIARRAAARGPPRRGQRRALVLFLVVVLKAPRLYELLLELVGLLVVEACAAVLVGRHDDHSLELELYFVQVDLWAVAHERAPRPATYNTWAARPPECGGRRPPPFLPRAVPPKKL